MMILGGFTLNASFTVMRNLRTEGIPRAAYITLIILGVCFFGSCLCWIRSIRSTTHLGYVFSSWHGITGIFSATTSVPQYGVGEGASSSSSSSSSNSRSRSKSGGAETEMTKEKAFVFGCFLTGNQGFYFSFAMKFIYISIPYYFFRFGTIPLYVSTFCIVCLECMWDYSRPYML